MRTQGISPKVWIPAAAQLAGAIGLYILGEQEAAAGLLSAALATAGIGGAASPGVVVRKG